MQRKSTEPAEQRDLAERNSACPPVFGTQRPVKSESGLKGQPTRIQINVCASDSKQEPDALAAHVRICTGGMTKGGWKPL